MHEFAHTNLFLRYALLLNMWKISHRRGRHMTTKQPHKPPKTNKHTNNITKLIQRIEFICKLNAMVFLVYLFLYLPRNTRARNYNWGTFTQNSMQNILTVHTHNYTHTYKRIQNTFTYTIYATVTIR